MGYIYKLENEKSKADNTFQRILKDLPPDVNVILSVANAFIKREIYDYAEKTYLQGKNTTISVGFSFGF